MMLWRDVVISCMISRVLALPQACDDLCVRVIDAERRAIIRVLKPFSADDDDDDGDDDNDDNGINGASVRSEHDGDDTNDTRHTGHRRSRTEPAVTVSKRRRMRTRVHSAAMPQVRERGTRIAHASHARAQPLALAWSSDARWLLVSALDAVRVYDVPAATLIGE
jgi:hypothetical protein